MDQHIIDVDSRGRISLGALAKHDRYLATRLEDGTIELRPAVILTLEQYNNLLSNGQQG